MEGALDGGREGRRGRQHKRDFGDNKKGGIKDPSAMAMATLLYQCSSLMMVLPYPSPCSFFVHWPWLDFGTISTRDGVTFYSHASNM